MKRIVTLLLSLCLAVVLFSGCELFKPKTQEGKKEITVIVDLTAYEGDISVAEGVQEYTDKVKKITYTTEKVNLAEVLAELSEDNFLKYGGSIHPLFGLTIEEIDGAKQDGYYYAIYTDNETEGKSITVAGKTVYYANYGASFLPVLDGKTYLIYLEEISW